MTSLLDIDWHRFRAGTAVGSRMDNRIYEITSFEYAEQVDVGMPNSIRQNIELELAEEPTGKVPPDWWLPNFQSAQLAAYIMLDDHAYMMRGYEYELPTMILKVELQRATWADESHLTPFQHAIHNFRQSLTSPQ